MRKQIIFNPTKAGERRIDYVVWARESKNDLQKPFWVELSPHEFDILTLRKKSNCHIQAEKQPGAVRGAKVCLNYFDLFEPKPFVAEDWL